MRAFVLVLLFMAVNSALLAQEAKNYSEPILGVQQIDSSNALSTRHRHQPEAQTKNAFRISPNEETARVHYYWLLNQGYDLEAGKFKEKNTGYTFALKPHRRGFESIYAGLGARISGNSNAGNIYTGGYGGFFRVSGTTRIWHSVSYLQQNDNLGHYKQGEYFSALYAYLGSGWYLKPSLHYAYVSFTDLSHDSYPVSYLDSSESRRGRYTVYKTSATQNIDYTANGSSHYVHIGLPVTKRIYQWTIEAQPSIHYIHSRSSRSYNYSNNGTTDSFRNNQFKGTEVYTETGNGTLTDTLSDTFIGQLGGSMSYRFQLLQRPVYLRGGIWYLFRDGGVNAPAYHAYILVQASDQVWLHVSFLAKGKLPFALESEGLYLNQYHAIKARADLTVQFFPLKHWSPLVTYQYEKQERYADGALLIYHALYLTLKYNL